MIRILASFSVGLVTGGLCVLFTFYDQCLRVGTQDVKSDVALSPTAAGGTVSIESRPGLSSATQQAPAISVESVPDVPSATQQAPSSHRLRDGCSTNSADDFFTSTYGDISGRFEVDSSSVGEVVCCSPDATTATRYTASKQCLSGFAQTAGRTYPQAVAICQGIGMRLCANQAELDLSCDRGCMYDNALVWTSEAATETVSVTDSTIIPANKNIAGLPSRTATDPAKFSLQVVVAYCCEDPTWLGTLSVDVPVTVYAKCPRCREKLDLTVEEFRLHHSQPIVVKELQNVGRELHTHIHHIIDNYDHLPTYTAFLQGEGGHGGTEADPRLRQFVDNASTYWPLIPIVPRNGKGTQMFRDADVFEPGGDRHHLEKETNVWVFRYADRKVSNQDLANRARALYMALFGGSACDVPPLIFMSGTMAIVRKDRIMSRPLPFWEHCKRLLHKCGPVGWDMERIWPLMFTTKDKPMRSLKKPSYCQNPPSEDWREDTKCPGGAYKKLTGWHGYP